MSEEVQTVESIAKEKGSIGDFKFPERHKHDAGYDSYRPEVTTG